MYCSFNILCFISLNTHHAIWKYVMSQEIGIQIAHFITRQRFSANLSTKLLMGAIVFVITKISWYEMWTTNHFFDIFSIILLILYYVISNSILKSNSNICTNLQFTIQLSGDKCSIKLIVIMFVLCQDYVN